jgi:hypothetical protein
MFDEVLLDLIELETTEVMVEMAVMELRYSQHFSKLVDDLLDLEVVDILMVLEVLEVIDEADL